MTYVVADTTKVRIFKQITTILNHVYPPCRLLLIPQRYEFSSKSQQFQSSKRVNARCCWYHKGTNFQANHNQHLHQHFCKQVVADTTKVRIFKQITTGEKVKFHSSRCCWYHKGTNFQANHNSSSWYLPCFWVVADTTKVRIFKQITTYGKTTKRQHMLLLIPQRYEFSSKSQHSGRIDFDVKGCCWYHKGTNFQANHNKAQLLTLLVLLLLIPQRYEFSSKSQQLIFN